MRQGVMRGRAGSGGMFGQYLRDLPKQITQRVMNPWDTLAQALAQTYGYGSLEELDAAFSPSVEATMAGRGYAPPQLPEGLPVGMGAIAGTVKGLTDFPMANPNLSGGAGPSSAWPPKPLPVIDTSKKNSKFRIATRTAKGDLPIMYAPKELPGLAPSRMPEEYPDILRASENDTILNQLDRMGFSMQPIQPKTTIPKGHPGSDRPVRYGNVEPIGPGKAKGWEAEQVPSLSPKKLPRSIEEYTRDVVPDPDAVPLMPRREAEFGTDIVPGDRLVYVPWDRTDYGKLLRGVNETTFDQPVRLTGGVENARRADRNVGASSLDEVKTIMQAAQPALDEGRRAAAWISTMGGGSSAFSNMSIDTVLQETLSRRPDPAKVAQFDKDVRTFSKAKDVKSRVKDYPGLLSPDLPAWLDKAGENRTLLQERISKGNNQKLGIFPDMSEVRFGIHEPNLQDTSVGAGGQNFAWLEGKYHQDPDIHSSYDTVFTGDYGGSLPWQGMPFSTAFSDFFKNRRLAGKPESSDIRSASMGTKAYQDVDEEWIDRAKRWRKGLLESGR